MAADLEGILLAAGESRRMGYPKPLLKLGNETYLAHLARAMLAAVPRLTIVIGAHADRVRCAIPSDPRVAVVYNPNYRRGQLSSIKAAIRSIPLNTTAVLIHLTDQPTVRAATFGAAVTRYRESKSPIVIARYRGRRGHPVLFDRELFAELLEAPEDQGARVVVNADPARVSYVDVDDPGILLDLDTPEDLDRAGLERPPKV